MMDTKNHSQYLIAKALSLLVNPLARSRYDEVSHKISKYLINHKSLYHKISERYQLSQDDIQDLIQRSATILSFSSLIGWDLGSRVSRLEALKGAAIGATIGLVLVLGSVVIKIFLIKHEHGFGVSDVKVEEAALDNAVAAYP